MSCASLLYLNVYFSNYLLFTFLPYCLTTCSATTYQPVNPTVCVSCLSVFYLSVDRSVYFFISWLRLWLVVVDPRRYDSGAYAVWIPDRQSVPCLAAAAVSEWEGVVLHLRQLVDGYLLPHAHLLLQGSFSWLLLYRPLPLPTATDKCGCHRSCWSAQHQQPKRRLGLAAIVRAAAGLKWNLWYDKDLFWSGEGDEEWCDCLIRRPCCWQLFYSLFGNVTLTNFLVLMICRVFFGQCPQLASGWLNLLWFTNGFDLLIQFLIKLVVLCCLTIWWLKLANIVSLMMAKSAIQSKVAMDKMFYSPV